MGKRDLSSIWATYRGWWLIVPAALLALAFGRLGVTIGVTVLSMYAFKELARATGLYRDWGLTIAVYLAIAAGGLLASIRHPRLDLPGWYGMFMALPVYAVALFVMVPIVRNRPQGQLQGLALAILGFLYPGWMLLHLGFLINLPQSIGYLLYLICAVQLNDVAAFTSDDSSAAASSAPRSAPTRPGPGRSVRSRCRWRCPG